MTKLREDIRNVAIIAHVDHGKTTLVDELLKQSHTLDERMELDERALDSNDLEKERGITILAKNTAVAYNGTRINIMDTPGHADFGGEVERIMKMVDGVVLVVDAYEGTMPQTRFVLKKALEQNLTPIVVVNKIDKPSARPEEVVDEVLELFIELGADDDQLEFPVVYASAINGTSSLSDNPADQEHTMAPIFDTIIDHIPAPVDNSDEPLQFQVSLLDYNDFVGRIGIGRIFRGTVKVGDQVTLSKLDGTTKNFRVTKLFGFFGLERREIEEAKAGDLIAISGMGGNKRSPSRHGSLHIASILLFQSQKRHHAASKENKLLQRQRCLCHQLKIPPRKLRCTESSRGNLWCQTACLSRYRLIWSFCFAADHPETQRSSITSTSFFSSNFFTQPRSAFPSLVAATLASSFS